MTDTIMSASPRLDPITLPLVQKPVDHVAERMGQVMLKTARSPILPKP
jgi:N-methylhydantoinase B/oxoprolinase/acetone carboxylase alpha subunit